MAFKRLVHYLILIFIAIIILFTLYAPGQLTDRIKGITQTFTKYVNITIGAEEIIAEKPEIPPEIQTNLNQFQETIQKALASPKSPCLINYQGFPHLKNFFLTFTQLRDKTVLTLNTPKQEIEHYDFPPFTLCVVAGNKAPKNFYKNYLGGYFTHAYLPDFSEVNKITIKKEKIIFTLNNKEYQPPLNQNYLYKPDANHLCFFPTFGWDRKWGCSYGENGLDNDCFNKFPRLIQPHNFTC